MPVPEKEDAIFDGWFTESIGGIQVTSETILSNSNNHTLYAHWKYLATFENFDLNLSFGKNRTNEYWSLTDTTGQGESVFVSENTTVYSGPYITGFHNLMSNGEIYRIYFKAKASSLVTTSAIFEAGGTTKIITIGTEYQEYFVDVTYNQASTYMALCFYTSTWTGQTLTVKEFKVAKIVTPGETYSTLPTPTKTSYSFSGWFTESSGGTQVTSSTVVSETASHTLYAHWNPNIIKLTLDKVGGTGGTDYIYYKYGKNKYYSNSSCTTEITTFEMPTKTGYTFIHYYGDGTKGGTSGERYLYGNVESGITPGTFADDLCIDIYADATLYAKWELTIYTVTFDKDGGSGGTDSITLKYGDSFPSISIPSRAGYSFKGYYYVTLEDSTQYYTKTGTSSKTFEFTSNITLTAEWVATDKTFERIGDYVYFGSYPQSIGLIPSNALVQTNGDLVKYNGNNYRVVTESDGTKKYYKYEKIKWKIVKEEGTQLTLIAEKILSASAFNTIKSTYYDNVYYEYLDASTKYESVLYGSTSAFYNSAFSSTEKNMIEVVSRTYYKYFLTLSSASSSDKRTSSFYCWVPSYEELKAFDDDGNSVFKTATAYASALGASDNTYWMSTGYKDGYDKAWYIKNTNQDNGYGDAVGSVTTTRGFVPMITIDISTVMDCGHLYDEANKTTVVVSDGDSGHHTETTYSCSKCSNVVVNKSSVVSHSSFETATVSYVQGDGVHEKIIKYVCSKCGHERTVSTTENCLFSAGTSTIFSDEAGHYHPNSVNMFWLRTNKNNTNRKRKSFCKDNYRVGICWKH